MTAFLRLPDMGRAVLLSVFFAALIGLLFLLTVRRIRLCRTPACLPPLLLLLLVALDLIYLMDAHHALHTGRLPTPAGQWAGGLPWVVHALLLFVSTLYCTLGLRRESQIVQEEITPDSIREALDNLPSGISFSGRNGIPLLTNRRMYHLSEALTGHLFRNAEELWQELVEFEGRNGIECVRSGESPVFCLPDGGVWQFTRAELTLDGERYIQTTAADITRLYTLSQELAQSNAALHAQHERLKNLLAQIVQIKREEEILASKVKLHDELGRCVLAGRQILMQGQTGEEIMPVFALWREAVKRLEVSLGGTEAAEDDTLRQLADAAAALGCEIEFEGELPQNEETAYLLLSAVREAVMNAVRHASADRVTVRLTPQGDLLAAEITDNGTKRPNAVTEGGGLKNLRRRVERAGGAMEVTCEGGVRLHLKLPLAEKEE